MLKTCKAKTILVNLTEKSCPLKGKLKIEIVWIIKHQGKRVEKSFLNYQYKTSKQTL